MWGGLRCVTDEPAPAVRSTARRTGHASGTLLVGKPLATDGAVGVVHLTLEPSLLGLGPCGAVGAPGVGVAPVPGRLRGFRAMSVTPLLLSGPEELWLTVIRSSRLAGPRAELLERVRAQLAIAIRGGAAARRAPLMAPHLALSMGKRYA